MSDSSTSGPGDALAIARRLVEGLDRLREALPPAPGGLGERLRAHLGTDPRWLPGVVERFHSSDRVNLQIALDDLEAGSARWELVGLPADIANYSGFSLTALASGRFGPHIDEQPVEHVGLPVGVDERLPCFRAGLVMTEYEATPVVLLVFTSDQRGRPEVVLEIVAAREEVATSLLGRLAATMRARNVFRGRTLSFSWGMYGEFGLDFAAVPPIERSDVVLPESTLAAIETHTVAMTRVAGDLLAAGQHLRRGLLLYGPPGTGKTHTVMYLCNQLAGRTVILLSGPAVHAIGQAGSLARELAPAMIVVEDVDLIAMDRSLPGAEHNPLLFQLLNEMDGIAADSDVIFVLTTNRVDLLEPALVARPGRIDQAVEIGLPDADARRRLLDLYLPDGLIDDAELDGAVERTEGAAAAFMKELARRCVLAVAGDGLPAATAIGDALDDMVEHSSPVLRATLGFSASPGSAGPAALPGGRWGST